MRHFDMDLSLLVFSLMLSSVSPDKTWKNYSLFVGPKPGETDRYMYVTSLGGKEHCHYCENKALQDSSYIFLQQQLCNQHYRGINIEDAVLPKEKEENKYPLCNKGETPACGPPPGEKKTENNKWVCDPGYSNEFYSVYFSCALVCYTTDSVQLSYYCNTSLLWELDNSISWQTCEVPGHIEEKISDHIPIYIGVGGAAFVLVISAIAFYCYCRHQRRKKAHSAEDLQANNAENLPNNIPGPEEQEPVLPYVQEENEVEPVNQEASVSNHSSLSSSCQTDCSEEVQPLLPRRKPNTCDTGTCPDEHISQVNEGVFMEGAVGGQPLANPASSSTRRDSRHNSSSIFSQKDKPGIKVILMKESERMRSIPLQGGFYTIEKGCGFAVVPNSPGGFAIKDFKIVRKDEGTPFRGKSFEKFFEISYATEEDAGLFSWFMRLENNEVQDGTFEICISYPDIPTCGRLSPVGQEVHPEIPTHTDITLESPHYTQFSSILLRSRQRQNQDSGLRDMSGSGSNHSRQMSRNRYNRTEDVQSDRIRSGNITVSSSGYESQRISEINQDRVNESPTLDIMSFESQGLLKARYSQGNLSEQGLDYQQRVRPDPAGVSTPYIFRERPRTYDPDDPDVTHRKEIVESEMQRQSYGQDDADSKSKRLDSVDLDREYFLSPCFHVSCTDDISEVSPCEPVHSPEFVILPQNLNDDYEDNEETVEERILPRSEMLNSTDSFEVGFVNNETDNYGANSSEQIDETKL